MDVTAELPACSEYAYNNSITMATKQRTFHSNYRFHPHSTWPIDHEASNPAARHYTHWMASVHDQCRQALEIARERMAGYDRSKPARDHKLHGPFAITKLITRNTTVTAVRLALPSRLRCHHTFHVSMVEPYRISERGGVCYQEDSRQLMDRRRRKQVLYLVR